MFTTPRFAARAFLPRPAMATNPAEILLDAARLRALGEVDASGPGAREAFDRLARVAARALDAPISCVSFLHSDRQQFAGAVGLPEPLASLREAGVEHSLCVEVVAGRRALVIGDTAQHRAPAGRRAAPALGIRAYAGVPLTTVDGHVLGTLCVCDGRPRRWGADALSVLEDVGALVVREVEGRRGGGVPIRDDALRAAESLFAPLVEQSLAAFYVLQDGVFKYANPRLAEVFGHPRDYYRVARPAMENVLEEDRAMVAENIRRRLAGEIDTLRYAFRGRRTDGEIVHVEVHGSRTELDGRPALVGVGIDVTDRVRAERERERALESRDRFYAMISHELRTPVSAIMLHNDLLASGVYEPLGAEQREAVWRSQRSARHLLELINDLLDLAKLQAGKLDTRVEDVDVAAVVDGAVSDVAALALEHACELTVGVERRPLVVPGDARRVRQILLNLLANALRFGAGAPVEVRCAVHGAGAVVEVTDRGPGIRAEDLERIFEDYVQVQPGEGGTGLGLPIARRLSALLGGTLDVRSEPGRGSTFRLVLPGGMEAGDGGFRGG